MKPPIKLLLSVLLIPLFRAGAAAQSQRSPSGVNSVGPQYQTQPGTRELPPRYSAPAGPNPATRRRCRLRAAVHRRRSRRRRTARTDPKQPRACHRPHCHLRRAERHLQTLSRLQRLPADACRQFARRRDRPGGARHACLHALIDPLSINSVCRAVTVDGPGNDHRMQKIASASVQKCGRSELCGSVSDCARAGATTPVARGARQAVCTAPRRRAPGAGALPGAVAGVCCYS
jgi:hypothetical protein